MSAASKACQQLIKLVNLDGRRPHTRPLRRYGEGVNPHEFDARAWFQYYFWMFAARMRAARGGSTPSQGMGMLSCLPFIFWHAWASEATANSITRLRTHQLAFFVLGQEISILFTSVVLVVLTFLVIRRLFPAARVPATIDHQQHTRADLESCTR